MDQPSKVANPARGQLNRENEYFLSTFAPENLVSRDGFGNQSRPASACSSPYSGWIWCLLTGSSRVPRRRLFIELKPPYAIGTVPSLSGHANAYRWRSLPRVRRHGASKPQGSSERVLLPSQVTMDQFICAPLSHTHNKLVWSGHVCWKYRHYISDPMLLPTGNPIKCHDEVLSLQPMIPPKRFDTPPPPLDWGMLRRSKCVQIFFETSLSRQCLERRRVLIFLQTPDCACLKKNQNVPRPSEYPPVRGKKCQNVY